MIVFNEVKLEIDETERRFGTSHFDLTVSVSDTTPFWDRDYNPVDQYVFNAVLLGFARDPDPRDPDPTRSNPARLARFGRVVTERQLRCTHFPRFECRFEWVERVLDIHRFAQAAGGSDNEIVMIGHGQVTVDIERLDVDKQTYFEFGNFRIPVPKAEAIFCRVNIIDTNDSNRVVATEESNPPIQGYFGANESRIGTGDDRDEEPGRPIMV